MSQSPAPSGAARQIASRLISGRELYLCDNFVDSQTGIRIGQLLKSLHYRRIERSRPDTHASGASAEVPAALLGADPFFLALRAFGEEMFPKERFQVERVYVNSSVYGDLYHIHRDCHPHQQNITVLFYGNMAWDADWGGETIFYNENVDAELAVTPRPGRVLVSRGAILHRGGVPGRNCHEERYTIAYKLAAL